MLQKGNEWPRMWQDLDVTALNKSGTWPSRTISHDRCTRLLRARRGNPRPLAADPVTGRESWVAADCWAAYQLKTASAGRSGPDGKSVAKTVKESTIRNDDMTISGYFP